MTEKEIKSLYNQIEELSTSEIQHYVDNELVTPSNGSLTPNLGLLGAGAMCGFGILNKTQSSASELKHACEKAWNHNISRIRNIINNNPKTSKTIMDILLLLAPAIAQQHTGISGMAIVGTLTILCKQNLGL